MPSTDTAFAGKIPEIYETHLGAWLFEPYARDLAERVSDVDSGTVLEIAAGTGIVTRALARTLAPSVTIAATDLNPDMIAFAANRTDAKNVTWRQADAQSLPFEDGSFRAAVCQFGMMFLPDKPKGFAEAKRVLAPGGRFVFSVWDKLENNEVTLVIHDTLARLMPEDPPRFLSRAPFAYFHEARIREDARAFGRVDVEAVEFTTRATATGAATGYCMGCPVRPEIELRRPGKLEEITTRVTEALAAHFGGDEFDNRMRAWVVTARP